MSSCSVFIPIMGVQNVHCFRNLNIFNSEPALKFQGLIREEARVLCQDQLEEVQQLEGELVLDVYGRDVCTIE